ncbi:MAG: hypothetical protein RIR12_1214 [Bacteroidota bacterium]|jgi:FKBP-type peptidyl-prolyl cis-trans isomerase
MKYLILLFISHLIFSCCSQHSLQKSNAIDGYTTTASGLKYKILLPGTGPSTEPGKEVLIFETTTYLDGTVLYSNESTKTPVKVLIGGNQATTAVDEGLRGMQVGEVR